MAAWKDPYGGDVLAGGTGARRRPPPEVPGTAGLRVRHRASGRTGRVVRWEAGAVVVRGELGGEWVLRPTAGAFEVDGTAVTLVRPRPAGPTRPTRTASGSVAVPGAPARVARASRILVEGVHDADLVERVWGDDLRVEGVVVERLDGADELAEVVASFEPAAGRRLGVLLDHLVDGSKESRLAAAVRHPHVLVVGHPFVDIWQAVRPESVRIPAWPQVPRGLEWKVGVCRALGWGSPSEGWARVRAAVRSWTDLEPALVGAVEQLIDFVTADDA